MAFHKATESVRNIAPQPTETENSMSVPIWINRRTSNRSASAPLKAAKKRNGTQCEITANPASAGE